MSNKILNYEDMIKKAEDIENRNTEGHTVHAELAYEELDYIISKAQFKLDVLTKAEEELSDMIRSAGLDPDDFVLDATSCDLFMSAADIEENGSVSVLSFTSEKDGYNYTATLLSTLIDIDNDLYPSDMPARAGLFATDRLTRTKQDGSMDIFENGAWTSSPQNDIFAEYRYFFDIIDRKDARAEFAGALADEVDPSDKQTVLSFLKKSKPLYKLLEETSDFMTASWVYNDKNGDLIPVLIPDDPLRHGFAVSFNKSQYILNVYLEPRYIDDDHFFLKPAAYFADINTVTAALRDLADRYTKEDVWVIPVSADRHIELNDMLMPSDFEHIYEVAGSRGWTKKEIKMINDVETYINEISEDPDIQEVFC